MDLAIMPECFIDTNLTETISPPAGRGYNHQKGWSSVIGQMKGKRSEDFAVGIIDKDKKSTDYINEFALLQSYNEQLELYKHTNKHHYIIYIIPAIEKFMLKCADEVGVSLAEFDINFETLKELTSITKSEDTKKDPKFKCLFRELLLRQAGAIVKLARWIDYLKSNNYHYLIHN